MLWRNIPSSSWTFTLRTAQSQSILLPHSLSESPSCLCRKFHPDNYSAYELDKFKDFRFVKVDIDDLKGLAEEVGVSQPATFHMYKNGEKINDLQSEHKEDLIQFLETGL